MPNEDHSKVRPFLDRVLGTGDPYVPDGTEGYMQAWTYDEIKTRSQQWLNGRSEMLVGREPGEFFLQYIHEKALGLSITDQLASEMSTFHEDFLFTSLFLQIPILTDARGLREQRKGYLDMYVEAINAKIESGDLDGVLAPDDVLLAANAFLDSVSFAALPALTGTCYHQRKLIALASHNLHKVSWRL